LWNPCLQVLLLGREPLEIFAEDSAAMWEFIEQFASLIAGFFNRLWGWLFILNRQEWILLLAAVSACGFLCMRGYGSRHHY